VTSASLTELKKRFNHYLRLAARGESVTILVRGKPVALLTGIESSAPELDTLVAAGLARPPLRPLPPDFLTRSLVRLGASVRQALTEDRDDRV
jgi:prevent-host-death family protein